MNVRMPLAVVRPMATVLNTNHAVATLMSELHLVVIMISARLVTGEPEDVAVTIGLVIQTLGARFVGVNRIPKLPTLAATPIVGVNHGTLVLVRALQQPQLIPSAQLHAQFNV